MSAATLPQDSGAPEGARGPAPRLVALDIDGTVLGPEETVAPAVLDAVRRARAAGAHVVLATGRALLGAQPVAAELELDSGWLVTSNGAVTSTINPFEVVDAVTFDAGPAVRLLLEHLPVALVAVERLGEGHYVTGTFPPGELTGKQTVVPLEQLVGRPVTRVVLRCPEHEPRDLLDLIERIGLHDVSYAVGYTAWLDIAPRGVTKASALERVRERLGVRREETLAVGDGRNDLEMLRWAAYGVAMGQAVPEVQDAADLVTGSVDDDGLATALGWWFH
ncbi:MAG: Cof-type HAD-IIB family hydrolase [Actinomycetota bacterium]|nr:Cof-type HAD-IIB family hydrolase [Actinomycetota bacterium]